MSCQTVSQTQEVRQLNFSPDFSYFVCIGEVAVLSSLPCRYCVLLITGDEDASSFGNQAFLAFASTNAKEVVKYAYVYMRLQQPLCDILLQTKGSTQSPTSPTQVDIFPTPSL